MVARNQSKFVTEGRVDDALEQGPRFEMDADDRQYIDNQIRGIQQHLVDNPVVAGDELDSDTFDWMPDTNGPAQSFNKLVDTANATPTALLTVAIPDESTGDYNATVLGRSDDGQHFRLDLRAGWERSGGVVTEIDAPSTDAAFTGNPGAWSANFVLSGTNAVVSVVGDASAAVRWNVLASTQLVKLEVTPFAGLASLNLSLYVPGSYSASPWLGAASAGTSLGRDLVSFGGSAPAVGVAVGGVTPPDFDGVTPHWLWSTPDVLDDLVGTQSNAGTGGSFAVLFNADTAAAPAGNVFDNPCLLASHGSSNFLLAWSTSGIHCGINDGVLNQIAPIACSTGAMHLAIVTFDGTTLRVYVDSAAAVTVLTGLPLTGASPGRELKVGTNYNQTAGFDGRIWTPMASPDVWDSTQIANIKSAINAIYGTAFT